MKKFVLLTILFAALLVPSCAKAVDMEGFYVGATGAADFLSNTGKGHRNGSYGHRNRNKYDVGFFGAIDLGYRWCSGLHLEAEVAYRYNQRKKDRRSSYGDFSGSSRRNRGHRDVWAAMVNVLYDINMCWCVEPYVGFGLGYAHVRNDRRRNNFTGTTRRDRRHNDDNAFAWQVIAGIAYPICDNVDVAVEYRFFDAVNNRRHQKNYYSNDIGVNVKYYF
jgi:opacity protein-like surface antigen